MQEENHQIAFKLAESASESHASSVLKAFEAYSQGNLATAKEGFAAALEWDAPSRGYLLYYLGLINYRQGNFQAAQKHLEEALQDPGFRTAHPELVGPAYGALGLAYAYLEENARALAALEQALECQYDANPFVYRVLGHCYYARQRLEQSAWAMEMAIQLDPGYADNYADIAFPYRDMGQRDKALASLKKFLELTSRPAEDPGVAAVKAALQDW